MQDRIVAWFKKPRNLVTLGLAVVLMILGHLLEGADVLGWLADVTRAFQTALGSVDALRIADLFYLRLSGCHVDQVETGVSFVCDGQNAIERFGTSPVVLAVFAPLDAAWATLVTLFVETTVLAKILLLVAIVASAVVLYKKLGIAEKGPFGHALWIVLIPAAAGLLVLAMKWLLLAITFLFSAVLGLLITFAVVIKWALAASEAWERAHKLGKGASLLAGGGKSVAPEN